MIEFLFGVIVGVVLAVLCPKLYAWASKVVAEARERD